MNLKQITAFVQVMLCGSVSDAARNLHRTQPAISALIAALEADLGMALFERRGGRLHPVPEAHFLHEQCREILQRLEATRQTMRDISSFNVGRIQVASMPGPSVFYLPDLLSRFAEKDNRVESVLVSRPSAEVGQLVAAQQFDVGLCDYDPRQGNDTPLVRSELICFECLCAMRADSPLASLEHLTPAHLDGTTMAALHPEHETSRNIQKAFDHAGAQWRVAYRTQYFIPLFTYIEKGMALAIVDPLSVASYRLYASRPHRIAFRPFRPVVAFTAALVTPVHRPASRLAAAFTEMLRQELTELKTC